MGLLAHSLIPHPGRLMQGITLPGLREKQHLGPVEARGAALEEPEDGVEKFHLALMLRHHREQSVVVLCGRVRHRLRAALSFVAGSSHVTRARMQFHANAMLAARVTTPSNLGQERKFWTTNRLQRGYVPPSLPHSFVLAGFVMERGEGGWGGTTSQGRIERCCLVRRIGDGACAGLQMLAQRVQHMRGSNNARLLPACSYSFCVLTGYVRAQEGSHCPQAPREGPGQRRCVRFSVSPNAKRRWATMQVVPCLIWLVALPSRPSHRDACLGEANA